MSNSISDDWCCNAKLRYKDYLVFFVFIDAVLMKILNFNSYNFKLLLQHCTEREYSHAFLCCIYFKCNFTVVNL